MSGAAWSALFLSAVAALALWMLRRMSYSQGRAQERIDADGQKVQALVRAARIRDRLMHDDDFARRVRERFTR